MSAPHNFSDDPGQFPGPPQQSNTATTVIIVIAAIGGVFLLMCGGMVALGFYMASQVNEQFDDFAADFQAQAQATQENMQEFQNASNNGDYQGAIDAVDEALAVDENNAVAHNNKGWLLATCPDEQFRDGELAVEHATKACDLTGWVNGGFIDTLAAAYAEAGDFEAAAEWQQKAIDADFSGTLTADFTERLELYQAGTPYREGPLVERQMEMQREAATEAVEAVESVFGDASEEEKDAGEEEKTE